MVSAGVKGVVVVVLAVSLTIGCGDVAASSGSEPGPGGVPGVVPGVVPVVVPGAAAGGRMAAGPVSGSWEWPVAPPHRVTAPFRAPPTRYEAGHRGIDLVAAPGAAVVAVDAGTVTFAGTVVDRPLIVVQHAGGVRSTLEPVHASVAVGAAVARGQLVGEVATGGHCGDACLHLGARLGDDYLNPLLFLAAIPRAVLLPVTLHRAPSVSCRRASRHRASRTFRGLPPASRHLPDPLLRLPCLNGDV
ncbi:peptidoglycan DD-metalloendopeptidase family protein [Herbiconiux sp. P18]|uniref:peptidoglycan DD-metalloendopeptidase family protein n=1 Tax=Herbiconiux liangxiaofengii TaxID=3342795 RepID=UPI0035BA3B98